MAVRKNFLFILRRPPHGGIPAQETLDIVLTTAAFDQAVRLLFLEDGVFQLKAGQRPEIIGFKHIAPIFGALQLYDVEELWVEEESLRERGLTAEALILPVRLLSRAQVPAFIGAQDVAVSC
jgi:tRNA 2-thiouridine synthesizing protein C